MGIAADGNERLASPEQRARVAAEGALMGVIQADQSVGPDGRPVVRPGDRIAAARVILEHVEAPGPVVVGPAGPRGERGAVGPRGETGPSGRDADEARIDALEAQVSATQGAQQGFAERLVDEVNALIQRVKALEEAHSRGPGGHREYVLSRSGAGEVSPHCRPSEDAPKAD